MISLTCEIYKPETDSHLENKLWLLKGKGGGGGGIKWEFEVDMYTLL